MNAITEFQGEYRFLSNFWLCPVRYSNIAFPSSEHAFQAAKTMDLAQRVYISGLNTPQAAKKQGRKVILRENWDSCKIDIMRMILWDKFTRNEDLMDKLLATGTTLLVEGNHWNDTFWGVCNGVGENHLGKLLMETRAKILMEHNQYIPGEDR